MIAYLETWDNLGDATTTSYASSLSPSWKEQPVGQKDSQYSNEMLFL